MWRKILLIFALVMILLFPVAVQAATVFFDDFNGTALGPAWTVLHPNPANFSVSDSLLHTSTQPGDLWMGTNDYQNLFLINNPLGGADFQVTMKVTGFHPGANYQQIDFIVYDDDDNHVRAGNVWVNGLRFWHIEAEVNGNEPYVGGEITDGAAVPEFYLRLVKYGNTYWLYTSVDGLNYQRRVGPLPYGNGTPQSLGFLAFLGSGIPSPATPLNIEFFQVESITPANFYDDFSGTALRPEWVVLHEDASQYSVSGGKLNTSTLSGDLWMGSNNYKNLFLVRNTLGGANFRVTMKVTGFNPGASFQQIDLIAYDDDDNHVRAGNVWSNGQWWDVTAEVGATPYWLSSDPSGATVADFYMRMEKFGTTYWLSSSLDGLNYQKRCGPLTYGDGAPKYFGFMAFEGSGVGAPPTPVAIDYFALERIDAGPAINSLLLD